MALTLHKGICSLLQYILCNTYDSSKLNYALYKSGHKLVSLYFNVYMNKVYSILKKPVGQGVTCNHKNPEERMQLFITRAQKILYSSGFMYAREFNAGHFFCVSLEDALTAVHSNFPISFLQ